MKELHGIDSFISDANASMSYRNDRYNKKLQKYYVVYEENDTELSEDEECTKKEDREVLDDTC